MRLVYIYHSGFALEADGFSILIDYFKDSDPDPAKGYVRSELLKRAGTLYILASHFHPDHFNPGSIEMERAEAGYQIYLFQGYIEASEGKADDAIYLKKGDAYQDELLTIKAFGSTDVGISFLIETEGRRIFHAGDLNNWHWKDESTPQEVAEAEGNYLKELDIIAKETSVMDLVHVPGRSSFGYRFHEGRPAIYRSYKNKRICPDALLGTSGGGYGFRPLRRIERMSLYRIVCSGRRDGYIIYY